MSRPRFLSLSLALSGAALASVLGACEPPRSTPPPTLDANNKPDAGPKPDVGAKPDANAPPDAGASSAGRDAPKVEVATPPAQTRIGVQGKEPTARPDWKAPWEDFDGPDELQPCFGGDEPAQAMALSDDDGWYTFFEGSVLPCHHHPGFMVFSLEQGKTVKAKFTPYNKRKIPCELFLATFDQQRLAEDGGAGAVSLTATVQKTGIHHLMLTCRGAGNMGLFELSVE